MQRNDVESNAPPLCRILSSIRSDLRCVQSNRQNSCSVNALEVIAPLESETDHMYTQLDCSYITAITSSAKASEAAKLTTGSNKFTDDGVPFDILHLFSKIDEVCVQVAAANQAHLKPIYRVACQNREELVEHRQCIINASDGLAQCNQKPVNETICDALEQFSNNIDCALRVMLDACTVEAQNVAVAVQDGLNDDLIKHKCYADAIISEMNSTDDDEFRLNPKNVRCSPEQENFALTCLVELIEINRKIVELNNYNFLREISQQNSTIISEICNLYGKYDNCITNTVFVHSNGKRCAFNSPLNTLARIGLLPICDKHSRMLLEKNSNCIERIQDRTEICQSGLGSLGPAIHHMLQGIHSEAYLCNSYYLIRDAFDCGEKIFNEMCPIEAVLDLRQLRQLVTKLGTEEGCPEERPSNLLEILSRPAAASTASSSLSKIIQPTSQRVVTCEPTEQKQFSSCIQLITIYQPHPLAVIKQPRHIDEACKQFIEFKKCQANISCLPLWAKGMTAMFNYVCGSGYATYTQVRQCVRKTTTREEIRECVSEFSRSAPQIACQSSKKLLTCSVPVINEKCGQVAAQFVTDYINKFVSVVDPTCKIDMEENEKSISGINCTAEQIALIDHCAAPINELTSRIDELFEGGLQQFLANVKNLAPVFAQGCNLTSEFRHCLRPILNNDEPQTKHCIVSSCLIRAGDGICDQTDTAKAIDDNLACIFKQASIPEFGKCLRSTIATLKQFNLLALRRVLPQFITCVEHIVVQQCGQIPINVLRAISATDICPISRNYQLGTSNYQLAHVCNTEMQQKHTECIGNFYRNYRMLPVALLRDPTNIDTLITKLIEI
uniref:DUF19 domain-containing protein n=1 Tax=Setaria digitata TaxID=48799 RepID=A0A915Q3K4_9BILA